MNTLRILVAVLVVTLGASHGRAASFTAPITGIGSGSVTTGSVTALAPLVLSGTEMQLPQRLSQLNTNFAITNLTYAFSNVITLNLSTNELANGALLTNAWKTAGTLATAQRPILVHVKPGKMLIPEVTYPSMAMAVDNVSTLFDPGTTLIFNSAASGPWPMWEDSAGARTNCHVYGHLQVFSTNDNQKIWYFNSNSRMYIEARSAYVTDSGNTAAVISWDGSITPDITINFSDYIESGAYDAIYGDVGAAMKFRGYAREVRAVGDLFEFTGSSPAWGNIDFRFDIGRQTASLGQPTFLQLGGRTKVSGSQIFVTSTISGMCAGDATTNGILEGFVIKVPDNATVSPIKHNDGSGNHGMHLRNIVLYGPTNRDIAVITNTAANPLILENCTFYTGWASTNWIRGQTPSFVNVLGGLNLIPFKPLGSQVTLRGTNYVPSIRNDGTLEQVGVSTFTGALSAQDAFGETGYFNYLLVTNILAIPTGAGPHSPTVGALIVDDDYYGSGRGTLQSSDGTDNIFFVGITNAPSSSGQVPTWNNTTKTWSAQAQSGSGGGGGTNFPNVNLLLGNTNLVLSAGVRKAFHNQTNGSHGVNLNLAVPESGYVVTYSVSNSSASDITVTFYTNSVAANPYDIATKTNVNTFTASASAITEAALKYIGSGIWVLESVKGPAAIQQFGTGIWADTNGANGLYITPFTKRLTNYAHATTITINGATDVDMTVTNDLAAGATYTIATPTIGSSGVVRFRPNGSAQTVAFQTWPAAIVPLSTNRFSNVTNIDLAASKWAYWNYDIARGTNGTTNCFVWVIQAP